MDKIALTIREAILAAGVSRSSLYAAIGRGELTARKRGKRTLILATDLRGWLEGLPVMKSAA
jgi:excisionase family DNA binding protein